MTPDPATTLSAPLLDVQHLTKRFGGLVANNDITFSVQPGEILAVIGPNGAGKSTLFNSLTGFVPPTSGTVHLAGQDITGLPPERTAELGLARTFQIPRSFPEMTVIENVMVGAFLRTGSVKIARAQAHEVLGLVGLDDRAQVRASGLNVAGQKRLELARTLATQPKLLLLDEVAGGLNSSEALALAEVLRGIHAEGVTLVLVEHVLEVVMSLAHRVIVVDFGQVIAQGAPHDVMRDERVIEAYLGRKARVHR